jgi:peptidoglycan/xylan/chitin deacetylase (PgdA/CDA1 family)
MEILAESPWMSIVRLDEGRVSRAALRVAVTFDDGYRDTLAVAAPILLKHKIPFTVFVTTAFVRSGSSLYLTPAELRELADLPGVTIGSHGMTHIRLAECDDHTLWQELEGSRLTLEDMIGKPVTSIAYPHGSADLRVRDAARRAGYRIGVCSRSGINPPGRDPLLLCRTEVVAADSERVFLQKLQGAWDWYRWRMVDPDRALGREVDTASGL